MSEKVPFRKPWSFDDWGCTVIVAAILGSCIVMLLRWLSWI